MKIMIIGAHPDDAEHFAGGTARLYVNAGHAVRFVSATNGDAGHQELRGPDLAERRRQEARAAAELAGAEAQILNHHDGRLFPTPEAREEIIALIRGWEPDLVLTHRPYDYHPDHRATSILVQDTAYLLTVPSLVPKVPHLRQMPVIAYLEDAFTRPVPFEADVAVDIGPTIEAKIAMLDAHVSQFYEWLPYNQGREREVPLGLQERTDWLGRQVRQRAERTADRCRTLLKVLYGEGRGSEIRYAEAFEASEYGRPLSAETRRELFPFF